MRYQDIKNNPDMCYLIVGTNSGGNCKTRVTCVDFDGEKNYDDKWQVCYKDGTQYFSDDRIGDFSVTFKTVDEGHCSYHRGLCGGEVRMANLNDWKDVIPVDTSEFCHNGLDWSNSAWDMSENGGDVWSTCGVPNL